MTDAERTEQVIRQCHLAARLATEAADYYTEWATVLRMRNYPMIASKIGEGSAQLIDFLQSRQDGGTSDEDRVVSAVAHVMWPQD